MVLTISQARSHVRPPLCGDALGMFSLQLHEFLVCHQWAWQCRPTLQLFNFACVVTVLMYSSNMHACMEWNTCKTVDRPKHMHTELGMCNCMEHAQVLQHSTCTLHRAHMHVSSTAWIWTCSSMELRQLFKHGMKMDAWNENGCMEWNQSNAWNGVGCMELNLKCMEMNFPEMHGIGPEVCGILVGDCTSWAQHSTVLWRSSIKTNI